MNHIDYHTLELFVLGAPEVGYRQVEIENHLAECAGCRELSIEMRGFYEDLSEEMGHPVHDLPEESTAIQKRKMDVMIQEDPFGDQIPVPRTVSVSYFTYFVRKHPIGTTVGSFGLAAALASLIFFANSGRDEAPRYVNYNTSTLLVEILNAGFERLWQFKSDNLISRNQDERNIHVKYTDLVDLDRDGTNEILTSMAAVGKSDTPGQDFRIYAADGELLVKKQFSEEVNYLDRTYSPYFNAGGFVTLMDSVHGSVDIFLLIVNHGRSPSALIRMNRKGEVIGKYWHFGQLVSLYEEDLDADGRPELILTGSNDVDDSVSDEYPVLIVLDPSKVVGEKKSTACPGYQMPTSNAERFYLKFPRNDMDRLYHLSGVGTSIEHEAENLLRYRVQSDYGIEGMYNVEYLFTRQMELVRVESNTQAEALRARLDESGKLSRRSEPDFIKSLEKGVRYWNGSGWEARLTPVSIPAG